MNAYTYGRSIAQRRKAMGWTQSQLAEKIGVSQRAVETWERGIHLPLLPEIIEEALKMSPRVVNDFRWQDDALCKDKDPDLFFPGPGESTMGKEAKEICKKCPSVEPCREWAIKHEALGVWGATTARERSRLRSKLNIRLETPQFCYAG